MDTRIIPLDAALRSPNETIFFFILVGKFERIQEYKIMEQVSNYKDAEEQELSHRMKKIAQVENVLAEEYNFREQVARNMARPHF